MAFLRLAGGGREEVGLAMKVVTALYTVTVVLGAPVHVVFSRYAADRLFDGHVGAIAAPLRRTLTATLVVATLVGAATMAALDAPLATALRGALLMPVVAALWLLVAVGSSVASPFVVLSALGLGAATTGVAVALIARTTHATVATVLAAFAAGQAVSLALLLRGVLAALPVDEDERARVSPAFARYWMLAAGTFAYHAALWTDKLVVYVVAGTAAASLHVICSTLAWFSIIPTFAWIYVELETTFYRRFQAFFHALLGGACLGELRGLAVAIRREALRLTFRAARIQAVVAGLAALAAPRLFEPIGLGRAIGPFRLMLLGASLQAIALLQLIILHYFDRRRDALVCSLVFLVTNTLLPAAAWWLGVPPVTGVVVASGVTALFGIMLVQRHLANLLEDTFQSQPLASTGDKQPS